MNQKRSVVVSPEITAYVGRGLCDSRYLPPDPILLGFGDIGQPAVSVLEPAALAAEVRDDVILLAIDRTACMRLFGLVPITGGRWYLPADLRGIGRLMIEVESDSEAANLLRAARAGELLCQLFAAFEAGRMVEVQGATTLSEREIILVAAAHELVVEHWQDKLTVGNVARRCGLGKAKLTRGFRELYRCTVAEAVAELRLEKARSWLAQSDLSVAMVGYRCGYMNNASFTRAFGRRFGMSPTEMRRRANDKRSGLIPT